MFSSVAQVGKTVEGNVLHKPIKRFTSFTKVVHVVTLSPILQSNLKATTVYVKVWES